VVDDERAEGLPDHEEGPRLPYLVAPHGRPREEDADLVVDQGGAGDAVGSNIKECHAIMTV
jgi:hypothetical protein